ncbi:Membrane-bound metallopeptidase, partial [Dysosmobacter welbionis]
RIRRTRGGLRHGGREAHRPAGLGRGSGPHPGGGLSGHGHRLFRGGWLDFEVRRGVLYGRCAGEPRGGGIHRLFRHRGVLLGQHRLAGGRYGGHAAHHGPWHRRRHRAGQQGDDAPVLLPVRGAGHLHCHLARRGGRLPLHLCPEAGGTAGPHGMGLRSGTGVLLSVGGRERHPDLRV